MTAGADEVSLGRGDSGTSLRMRETLHRTAHCTGEPWRVTAASAKLLKQALASDRVRSGLSPAGGVWATPSPAAGRSRSGPRKPIVPGPGTRDRPRRLLSGREEPPGLPPRGVSEARGHRGHAEPAEPAPGPGSTRALRPVAPWLRAPPVGRGRGRRAEARTLEGPGPGRPTSLGWALGEEGPVATLAGGWRVHCSAVACGPCQAVSFRNLPKTLFLPCYNGILFCICSSYWNDFVKSYYGDKSNFTLV